MRRRSAKILHQGRPLHLCTTVMCMAAQPCLRKRRQCQSSPAHSWNNSWYSQHDTHHTPLLLSATLSADHDITVHAELLKTLVFLGSEPLTSLATQLIS